MTTRPRPAPPWRVWRSSCCRPGSGAAAGRRSAPTSNRLHAIVRAFPDTLTGDRDKALVLTGFHYASRSQDPAGLLVGDVTSHPRGLVFAVLTGKTKHSVRNARIRYADDPEICPMRAWTAYRTHLVADPSMPAFASIDRWGHVTGGESPRPRAVGSSCCAGTGRRDRRAGVTTGCGGQFLERGGELAQLVDQGGGGQGDGADLGVVRAQDVGKEEVIRRWGVLDLLTC
ncbi:hypothetical protein ACIP3A_39675 [Streptomyces tricolor]|uniref:hypothetical protein n=1 Tax=Streptomyces TaxID=1883 RepID=UPI000AF77F13|nr:hypothetical protein [Streptomyces sp. PBH53]